MRKISLIIAGCILLWLAPCYAPDAEFGTISMLTANACAEHGVDRNHVDAIFMEETGYKNQIVFEKKICKYSYGPGCILFNTAAGQGHKGKEQDLIRLDTSIPLSVSFIHSLHKRYNGNWTKIMSHYRTGKSHYKSYGIKHDVIYQSFKEANHD